MSTLHAIVPDGLDDAHRPSGGNVYDRRVLSGLAALGRDVEEHAVGLSWPRPGRRDLHRLGSLLDRIEDGAVVLIDGLVASPAARVLVPASARLRVVVLVHLPLGPHDGEGAVLRSAAAVVTTSAWAAARVREWYDVRRLHVVHPGVDRAPLARGTTLDGAALLCVGAVHPGKGHDLLLDALDGLSDRWWALTCAGALDVDPAYTADLRRRVHQRGWDRRVRWAGPLDGARLAAAYEAADLVVVPSRVESYGMVVTESLARGIPVAASRVGGVPEAVGRGRDGGVPGLLVPPTAHALAGALASWLGEPTVRTRLRAAAADRRLMLAGWEETVAALSEVLGRAGADVPDVALLDSLGGHR